MWPKIDQNDKYQKLNAGFILEFNLCIYIYIYIYRERERELREINIHTYEDSYFLSFKHSQNKIFIYIYYIRIYSTYMCIET